MSSHNPYTVLNLPSPPHAVPLSLETIRRAYRNALLTHHPDKSKSHHDTLHGSNQKAPSQGTEQFTNGKRKAAYSIDDIISAYQKLSHPKSRAEIDRLLSLRPASFGVHTPLSFDGPTGFVSSFDGPALWYCESVDLDDMTYDEGHGWWCKSCRCGLEKGYIVKTADLEKGAASADGTGEIIVGCTGCSLWIKVGFAMVQGDEEEG